ncbi:MAG: diaminopimelate decarboxylase [bacterium]|nr:diaminopimelate decarboxylase [bacterium]
MAENKVKLLKEIAKKYSTPVYVYYEDKIISNINNIKKAFLNIEYKIFYAVKANSNTYILRSIKNQGVGFECVSMGEILAARKAGASFSEIIFDGVGKKYEELEFAVNNNLYFISVESLEELKLLNSYSKPVNIAIRFNPNIDPITHRKIKTGHSISKFGIDLKELTQVIKILKHSKLKLKAIHAHIGSQIFESDKFKALVLKLLEIKKFFNDKGFNVSEIDIGGGFGVHYIKHEETRPNTFSILKDISKLIPKDTKLIIEPGRSIIADAGVLITKVLYAKKQAGVRYLIVDAGMNDLIRPAMYDAYHEIESLDGGTRKLVTVAGGVCESSDIFGVNRMLPFRSNIYLVIKNAGAYGYSMSSNYNLRPKPPEVIIKGNNSYKLIRKREEYSHFL